MPTVRENERSWAIEIISYINQLLARRDLLIKRAGGESTLSSNKKSMFPDVLLYSQESRTTILQGWELKMPDVLITDQEFYDNATKKANTLSLNSFILWNFSYGKLFIKDDNGSFSEAKVWALPQIKTRDDVDRYQPEWRQVIEEMIIEVNEFLVSGKIMTSSIIDVLSDNIMTAIIDRNKHLLADYYRNIVSRNMVMEQKMLAWWKDYKEEFTDDEPDYYAAYAKNVLLNWTNRIIFANVIRRHHNSANQVSEIDYSCQPSDANVIMENIINKGDYFNVFSGIEFDDLIPNDVWIDIVEFNQFLDENRINNIDQSNLQDLLEKTVNSSKREVRGQYATPKWLANFLCQITVIDWAGNCADTCAGTGTIARMILNNKNRRRYDTLENFSTTWVSDKYAYPIQIANIALTSIDAINIPINLFKENVFNLSVGKEIIVKSPIDGSDINLSYPHMHAIMSNLPFISSANVSADDSNAKDRVFRDVKEKTELNFNSGRMDLYMAIPFKLHEILLDEGRLGIIISNAWLATDAGRSFYNTLLYYYNIISVVMSGKGRWFKNADVVTTILILEKKVIQKPLGQEKIAFYLLSKDMEQQNDDEISSIINNIVLACNELNEYLIPNEYTISDIATIQSKGYSLNTLFHDAKWVEEISSSLVPITEYLNVFRGERRGWDDMFYPREGHGIEGEYIKRVLKSSRSLQKYEAITDSDAFCCDLSLGDLRKLKHNGTISWIERFSGLKNGAGRPLPDVLRKSNCFWYEMKDNARADFVTSQNPDRRLFFSIFQDPAFINQRLIGLRLKKGNRELVHALLNTLFEMFCIEGLGFGRGLGVLDMNKDNFEKTYILNPEMIDNDSANEIIKAFNTLKKRDVMDVENELQAEDRELFDRIVLRSFGIESYYERIKKSVLSMQKTRLSVR